MVSTPHQMEALENEINRLKAASESSAKRLSPTEQMKNADIRAKVSMKVSLDGKVSI